MFLPKKPAKNLQNASGQVLILFLLILVVGLAIVLSIASRTITDTRTTTTSDESNRAYFAAEAGIEEALRQLQDTGSIVSPVDINFDESNSSATTVAADSPGSPTFVYPNDLKRDEVAQVNMLEVFNNLSSAGWSGSALNIYWGSSVFDSTDLTTPAIEVSVVYIDNSNNFFISKAAFDPITSGRTNGFCNNVDKAGPFTIEGKALFLKASINIFNGSETCGSPAGLSLVNGTHKPVLMRIRALYNSVPTPLAVEVESGPDLPSQSVVVTSTGTTASGVTRKLKVTRLYPAMPALFDYVLFNGNSSKPLKK